MTERGFTEPRLFDGGSEKPSKPAMKKPAEIQESVAPDQVETRSEILVVLADEFVENFNFYLSRYQVIFSDKENNHFEGLVLSIKNNPSLFDILRNNPKYMSVLEYVEGKRRIS